MVKLGNLFGRNKEAETIDSQGDNSSVNNKVSHENVKNWYEDRFETIVTQRNLLFVLLVLILILTIIATGVIAYVVNSKKFDPFVIQIDDLTGRATIVTPTSSNLLSANDALAQYFIKKYVTARETYNNVDFGTISNNIIRLLSANPIYWEYRGYIKNPDIDPTIKYGQKNSTFLITKSWSKLADNKFIIRFSINETAGAKKIFNKIAVVEFQYMPMELSESEKEINPVGFQVTGYRVDDDSS